MDMHGRCRYTGLDRECTLEELAGFHGHLGPYIVIGYRMGRYIRKHFCGDPFSLSARIYCSGRTPETCLADGVQLGSGCTIGKGNIDIIMHDSISVEFATPSGCVICIPRPYRLPPQGPDFARAVEDLAVQLFTEPDETLFDVITS